MIHWKGSVMCVVDVETNGLEQGYNEVIQLCIMPLTTSLEIDKTKTPFYVHIKPDYPERTDPAATRVHGITTAKLNSEGIDSLSAVSMFERWYNKLCPLNKGGEYRTKIIPLGHNYAQFDKPMIESWLVNAGYEYNDFFHWHPRDTQIAAATVNDRHAMRQIEPPFRELNLNYLGNKFGFTNLKAHDAFGDCDITVKVYKQLCQMKENSLGAL